MWRAAHKLTRRAFLRLPALVLAGLFPHARAAGDAAAAAAAAAYTTQLPDAPCSMCTLDVGGQLAKILVNSLCVLRAALPAECLRRDGVILARNMALEKTRCVAGLRRTLLTLSKVLRLSGMTPKLVMSREVSSVTTSVLRKAFRTR